jgi:hypothetical protein
LVGVLFQSQPPPPPSQPEEKSIPANTREGGLSPHPREEVEVGIPATIQGEQPLPSADGTKEEEISTPILEPAASPPKEHPKWEIRPCRPREFDKVGRLFLEGGDIVIKVDGLPFYLVSACDVWLLCNGEMVAVRETGDHSSVGTARPSVSGRAVNFRIGDRLYTVPYRNVRAIIEGRARKAAVFAGNGGDK